MTTTKPRSQWHSWRGWRHYAPNRKGTSLSILGWATLSLGVVLGGIGLWLDWTEFLAVSIFMLLVLLCALAFTVGRSSYRVNLELAQNRISMGQRAFGQIQITNVGRRGLLPARIELPVGTTRAEFMLPRLGPEQAHEEIFTIPTHRRAVIAVGPVSSVRTDPLGIARRELVWTDREDLFVHPQIVQLGSQTAGFMKDLEGQTRNTITDNDMDFHALREYVPGDDRRSIHWKSSARNQNLMVRQFEDTRRTFTSIALENMASAWDNESEYELGISILASIGIQVIREGMELAVFTGQKALRVASPRILLDETCRITQDQISTDYVSPAQVITKKSPAASLAIVITGSIMTQASQRHMAAALSPNLRVLFISCQPGTSVGAQRVGQVTLSTLGELADLPKLLRKVVVA